MFCIYCGAKIHDEGKFCSKCGKPVPIIVEKTIPEEAVAEEAVAEEAVTEEAVTEETITEEAVVKPEKGKSLARKNFAATMAFIISSAIVAVLGIFIIPKLLSPSVINKAAEKSTPEAALTLYKAADNTDAVYDTKFTIARNALDNENYALAAALFSELKHEGYKTDKDMVSYVDEALGGRCRVLINGGKYIIAQADSTQISDELLGACVVNDTIISQAKLLSSEGRNAEAYEALALINTSAAYDSDSYDIIVYNYAVGFYNEKKFNVAYDILVNATDEASVELRCASAYQYANKLFKDTNYEMAIPMYENADGYANSYEKLKQCNYQLGLRCYNTSNFKKSLEYFTAADGYKESASYIKKLEEKLAYKYWNIDGFTTDYINSFTGRPNPEKNRIAKNDDFIYFFTVTNENNNKNGITLNIQITTPDGHTADETFYNVHNGDVNFYSAAYEFPLFGAKGDAYFTVTLVETGEVLDICRFEIY